MTLEEQHEALALSTPTASLVCKGTADAQFNRKASDACVNNAIGIQRASSYHDLLQSPA